MMLDLQNLVSDNQDLSQVAGAYLSDYSIDLGVAGVAALGSQTVPKDAGKGDVEIFCQVTETFVGATSTTTVELVMADNAALDSGLVVLQSTAAIAVVTLVAGYQFRIGADIPPGISKRFLGLRYTIATATTTAGKITAGIVADRQTNPSV